MVDQEDEQSQEELHAELREHEFRVTDDAFFLRTLEADVKRAESLVAVDVGDEFARRTLVRTVFAEVEGVCSSAIDWARYYAQDTSVYKEQYTPVERAFLATHHIARLNNHGVAEWQPSNYPGAKQTIRFALALVGREAETAVAINYGDGGWQSLCDGLAVRDRLMHPKDVDDVKVTDADLANVRRGHAWFVDVYKAQKALVQRQRGENLARKFREWMAQDAAARARDEPGN